LPKQGAVARVIDKETRRAVSVVMTSRTDIGNLTTDDILIRPGLGAKRLPGYKRLPG